MIKTGEDQSISKCHAHVSNRMGLWIISDADSKKGIFRFLHNQTTLKEDLESPKIEIFDNDTLLFGKDTVMRVKKTDN